ncbi:hypothetical protein KY285_003571 [Solanum tuberosum]|nr:hypothetical protein KY284_003717 [Solanum tuberosum]KAH0767700.1 hypothetical protein KY285_003571 [Solanum tuberosum]
MSSWSRQAFVDLYEEPKRLEIQTQALEDNHVTKNTGNSKRDLSRLKAEFTRFLKLQESILKQKGRVNWLEGYSNTAYFLNIIRDKRKRSNIRKIMDEHNNCLEGNDKIAEGAIRFYKNLFTYDNTNPDYSSLNILYRCNDVSDVIN